MATSNEIRVNYPSICDVFKLDPTSDKTAGIFDTYTTYKYSKTKSLPTNGIEAMVKMGMPPGSNYTYSYLANRIDNTSGSASSNSYKVTQNMAEMGEEDADTPDEQ